MDGLTGHLSRPQQQRNFRLGFHVTVCTREMDIPAFEQATTTEQFLVMPPRYLQRARVNVHPPPSLLLNGCSTPMSNHFLPDGSSIYQSPVPEEDAKHCLYLLTSCNRSTAIREKGLDTPASTGHLSRPTTEDFMGMLLRGVAGVLRSADIRY